MANLLSPAQIETFTTFGTIIGLVILAVLNQLSNRRIQRVAAVADKTHLLVNSNYGAQLRIVMLQAERIASLTKDPQDLSVATESKRLWEEHQKKQTAVDLAVVAT